MASPRFTDYGNAPLIDDAAQDPRARRQRQILNQMSLMDSASAQKLSDLAAAHPDLAPDALLAGLTADPNGPGSAFGPAATASTAAKAASNAAKAEAGKLQNDGSDWSDEGLWPALKAVTRTGLSFISNAGQTIFNTIDYGLSHGQAAPGGEWYTPGQATDWSMLTAGKDPGKGWTTFFGGAPDSKWEQAKTQMMSQVWGEDSNNDGIYEPITQGKALAANFAPKDSTQAKIAGAVVDLGLSILEDPTTLLAGAGAIAKANKAATIADVASKAVGATQAAGKAKDIEAALVTTDELTAMQKLAEETSGISDNIMEAARAMAAENKAAFTSSQDAALAEALQKQGSLSEKMSAVVDSISKDAETARAKAQADLKAGRELYEEAAKKQAAAARAAEAAKDPRNFNLADESAQLIDFARNDVDKTLAARLDRWSATNRATRATVAAESGQDAAAAVRAQKAASGVKAMRTRASNAFDKAEDALRYISARENQIASSTDEGVDAVRAALAGDRAAIEDAITHFTGNGTLRDTETAIANINKLSRAAIAKHGGEAQAVAKADLAAANSELRDASGMVGEAATGVSAVDTQAEKALSGAAKTEAAGNAEIDKGLAQSGKTAERTFRSNEATINKVVDSELNAANKNAEAAQAAYAEKLKSVDELYDVLGQAHGLADALAAARNGDTGLLRAAMEEEFGLSRVHGVDPEKLASALFGGTYSGNQSKVGNAIMNALVKLDSPLDIYNRSGRQIPVAVANELADAKSLDEVTQILAKAVGDGTFSRGIRGNGALLATRLQQVAEEDPVNISAKLANIALKPLLTAYDRTQRVVPWAYRFDLNNPDVAVPAWQDWLNMAFREANMARISLSATSKAASTRATKDLELIADLSTRMMRANTPAERRQVIANGFEELTTHLIETRDVKDVDAFRNVVSKALDQGPSSSLTSNYFAMASELTPDEALVRNGVNILDPSVPRSVSQFSDTFSLPDVREYRRIIDKAASIKEAGGTMDKVAAFVNNNFDRVWRIGVLTFRIAYVLRNIGEMQFRMYLNGSLHDPLSMIGVVASGIDTPAARKLSENFGLYGNDVLGRDFITYAHDDMAEAGMDAMRGELFRTYSTADPGFQARAIAHGGMIERNPNTNTYINGLANMLMMRRHDKLQSDLLRVLAPNSATPKHIAKWQTEHGIEDPLDALTDYYYNGLGKTQLDLMRTERPDYYGKLFSNQEDFKWWLAGENNPASVASELDKYTVGFDSRIVDGLFSAPSAAGATRRSAQKDFRKTLREVRDEASSTGKPFDFPVWVENNQAELLGDKKNLTAAANWFFSKSAIAEGATAFSPETRIAYWRKIEELADFLTPEARQQLLGAAETSLKPIRMLGADGKAVPIGKQSRLFNKIVDNPERSGKLTLEEAHEIAAQHAARHTKDLFYDAMARKQTWSAMRLLFPFGQAWSNTMVRWGQLGMQNPIKVYNLDKAYNAFTENGTDPGDPLSSTMDPSKRATIYRDPKTNQMVFDVPLVGDAISALTGSPGLVNVQSPLTSYNLATGGGVPLPGVGPVITLPFKTLMNVDWFKQATPDFIQQWVEPFPSTDSQASILGDLRETLVPAWMRRIITAFDPAWGDKDMSAMMPVVSNYLTAEHPDRYKNQMGIIDAAGKQRLADDVNTVSRWTSLYRGIFQSGMPGSMVMDWQIKTQDGNHPSQVLMTNHYWQMVQDNGGDLNAAMKEFGDLYGADAAVVALSNWKTNTQPSSKAWEFVKNNQGIADKNSDIIDLFFAGGSYAAEYDKWLRRRDKRVAMTLDERIAAANTQTYFAVAGRLDEKVQKGLISADDAKALKEKYANEYGVRYQKESDFGATGEKIARVRSALQTTPELAATPGGQATAQYLKVYDAALQKAGTATLGGKKNAEIRAYMRQLGERLVSENEDFALMWRNLLSKEVSE